MFEKYRARKRRQEEKIRAREAAKPILTTFDRVASKAADIRDHAFVGLAALTVTAGAIRHQGELDAKNDGVRAERLAEEKFNRLVLEQKRKVAERVQTDLREGSPELWDKVDYVRAISMPKTVDLLYQSERTDHPELKGLSPQQYLDRNFLREVSSADIPPAIQAGLRYHIDGLIGWESGWNKTLIGYTKDVGAVQAKPDTLDSMGWEGPERHEEFRNDFTEQVDFLNKLYVDMYRHLSEAEKSSAALNTILRLCFDGDLEAMQREFIVPVLLNAHNAGMPQMIKVVSAFAQDQEEKHENGKPVAKGFEAYETMRSTATDPGYNDIEREYVVNVMGTKEAMLARSLAQANLTKKAS